MVHKILTSAGFVINQTYKETRFLKPPRETFAVFLDACEIRGADNVNGIEDHDYSIELYEYTPDPEAEKRIEAQFDLYGIPYEKQTRYWVQDEQLYQVIYDFSYTIKRRL